MRDREAAFEEAQAKLRAFLRAFETYQIAVTQALTNMALRHAAHYNLKAHDALHVALTTETGVHDLIALDRDFGRVDSIVLWSPA